MAPEPIAYTLIHARLRDILAAQTRIPPVATMQMRILANHSASVLWWLGQGRGHAVSWYDREEAIAGIHTGSASYFAALDQFCQLNGIPPLDSRQPYATIWQAAQRQEAAAPVVVAPQPVTVPRELVTQPAPSVPAVVARAAVYGGSPDSQLPPIPVQNGRARLRSQLEASAL